MVSGVRKRFISAVRPLGSLLVGFRDRGEASHIGEHDRHLALFAAEHELFRRLRQLFDQRRRQILAERRTDLPPLRLLPDEARKDQRQIDRRGRYQGIGEIDQQPMLGVEKPGRSGEHRCEQPADDNQRDRTEFRSKRDDQQSHDEGGEKFERNAVIRLRDHRAGQRALQHLGVDLHAGHGGRDRRGLDVVQSGRRRSDQHQLARDPVRCDAAFQHIDGRDIDRGIPVRIMHPELAIAIGRDGETLDADALDAGLVGLDQDRPRAARDPQHLEAQGRHGDALGHHDHRHAADNAVTLGLDGEQAAPGRRLLQHGHVAQQPRELEHERLRLLAEHRKSGHWKFRVEIGANVRATGFSEHHARIADGIGKNPVIARQRPQSRAHLLIEIAEGVGEELGIEPVGLGEHGVERDHHGAEPGQVGNDVGDARPRPRPLTEFRIGQAPFVDVDDRDRPHRLLAWFQHLEDIEGSDPDLGDRSRIPNPQRGKADQERKADQPRIAEAPLEPPP